MQTMETSSCFEGNDDISRTARKEVISLEKESMFIKKNDAYLMEK